MMKILSFSLLLFVLISCQQQPKYDEQTTDHKGFRSFYVLDDSIIALGTDNELISIDPQTRVLTPISSNVKLVNSVNNGLIYVNSPDEIIFYKSSGKIQTQIPDSMVIAGFVQPNTEELYVITNNALINSTTGELFAFRDAPLTNEQFPIDSKTTPESMAIDMGGNIWVGFNYGEWGGELIVFNIGERTFETIELGNLDLNICHIDNLTPTNSGVLLSYGRGHGYNDGLIHFKNLKPDMILDRNDSLVHFIHNGKQAERWDLGFEIGPVAYSPLNNKLYFYSAGRILSGELTQGMPNESYWKEEFTFYNFIEHGIGELDTVFTEVRFYPNIMITKLALLDTGNLAFLTMNNGIGTIQNGNLTMYK